MHLEIKFYIFVCVCVSEYTYGYRNAHKTNNMQPSLIHYEFVTLFFDKGLTSEKYQTDGGKCNINKWYSPRQTWNIVSYATLFMVVIRCSSFTTLNPIALQILTKLKHKHIVFAKTRLC